MEESAGSSEVKYHRFYCQNVIDELTSVCSVCPFRFLCSFIFHIVLNYSTSQKSVQTEDLVSNNSVLTATSTGGGGIDAADSANNGAVARFAHQKQDSDDSETLEETHQRKQKMLELFRTIYLRRFSADTAPPGCFPFNTATSKLSVIDAVTKSYYPQYREMQRAIARDETSWPFTKEEADRHRAEGEC